MQQHWKELRKLPSYVRVLLLSTSSKTRLTIEWVTATFDTINFESHRGSHPRLGVVDHVCFHPLAQTSLDQAASLAKSLAANIGSCLEVPTYLYGAAHQDGRTLDSVRRKLGYFRPSSEENLWEGCGLETLPLKPDMGPDRASRAKGVIVVGSTRWVDNYKIPIFSTDITAVRRIARRGGGLPLVQAMALTHGENITEVAYNLLDPSRVSADQVQLEVECLTREEGFYVRVLSLIFHGKKLLRIICSQIIIVKND